MSQIAKVQSIDEIVENFPVYLQQMEDKSDTKPVTFWIPREYKAIYDQLQLKTNRRFSKVLIEVLKGAIDKVSVSSEADAS